MESLKYTVIKSKAQYKDYCKTLEELIEGGSKGKAASDEVDLLTLLIEKWDEDHNGFMEMDPIKLLHSFMIDHNMKARDLVKLLNVSKGYVSDILNYKKGLSKEIIRDLSTYFKVSQEAFNRPYKLKSPINAKLKNASVMNTRKALAVTR
jgi:HTH-type transcriptional regulator/antitoxin HigA